MVSNKEQTPITQQTQKPVKKLSIFHLIRKYFWFIVVFFIIAITSGVLMADYESKSTAGWKTFISKDAALSFKHPETYKIVEDKGWRLTIYTSERFPENNIKILYSHKGSDALNESPEEQFLANCQATKVNELTANGTRIKVYEDSTCDGQTIANSVIVYSENDMDYDIGLFGETNRQQLYTFLSTLEFGTAPVNVTPVPTALPSQLPSQIPSQASVEGKMCGGIAAFPCPTGFSCKLDGDYPDAGGKCVQETKPEEITMCTMDAKQCPDGSFVGRTGPKCEFVCPNQTTDR